MISVRLLLQKTDLIIMKVKFENQKKIPLCVALVRYYLQFCVQLWVLN